MSATPILRGGGTKEPSPASAQDEVTGALVDRGRPLMWRQLVPRARDYELRQGEAVLGEMEPSHAIGSDAVGECLGRTLELHLDTGLFRRVRVATTRATAEKGPEYRGLTWGWGRIDTPEGETLRWRHSFRGLYAHVLLDSAGAELLHLQPTFMRFVHLDTRVTVSPTAWGRADVAELLLLTWFLRVHAEARGRRVFRRPTKRAVSDFS